MVCILGFCGYTLAKTTGLIIALVAAVGIVVATGRGSASMVLNMYKAIPIQRQQAPGLVDLYDSLVERSTLEYRPEFYYIPSQMMNAFATGRGDQVAVAVTDGLIRNLNAREMAGVLAHELSHVMHDDVFVMTLADAFSRVTSFIGQAGIWILILSLPAYFAGYNFPWFAGILFLIAPSVTVLLQLALSRSREYDADESGARLTGDPIGLAMALKKIEHRQGGWMERILLPGRKDPHPAALRTHPPTQERIDILKKMAGIDPSIKLPVDVGLAAMPRPVRIIHAPRWHMTGLWY